jgi:hypothetical protein
MYPDNFSCYPGNCDHYPGNFRFYPYNFINIFYKTFLKNKTHICALFLLKAQFCYYLRLKILLGAKMRLIFIVMFLLIFQNKISYF